MSFKCDAAVMRAAGTPEVLEMDEIELPWPGRDDEVLVRIEAAGVNPADTFFRALGPYVGEAAGTVLGHDGAGVVEAVGASVSSVAPGDRVGFCNGGIGGEAGTYARYAVVPEWLLAPVPDGVDSASAAALPLVFVTAWESLVERAGLAHGERVLIHAGAGGTGHVAIQLARELGARVATTVSSAAKANFVGALGAELAIDYRGEDFVARCLDWSDGGGLEVALDNVGPDAFVRTLAAMAPYGRVVTLMGMPGDTPEETAYNANLTIHNVMMLTPMWRGLEAARRRQAEIVREGMRWLEAGKLRVELAATFPLERAGDAHRLLEQGGVSGKIVLTADRAAA